MEDGQDNLVQYFKPQLFQEDFMYSTASFVCRVGPWGDGKTLCMIMKGMVLSQLYPGNEGLIIRTRYNALQRSTMRDFTKWTGLGVNEQKKFAVLPGCGSVIHFAHCENITEFEEGIKGMNLGWVGIEQGDEMDTADIFEMFFGRVRRVLTPNVEVQKKLVRRRLLKKVISNFERLTKEQREKVESGIIEKLNLPVRQIMVIGNACGHNWIWRRWNPASKQHFSRNDGYDYSEGRPFENKEYIPGTTLRNWESLRITSPKKYNRYILNSHEDYDIEGAYYASLMSDALKEGRVEVQNLYDKTEQVYTFWDLGTRGDDSTSIWFVQFIGESINLIDFYGGKGYGMEHYSQVLDQKKYRYGGHYLPHDARSDIQAIQITTRYDILKRLRRPEDIFVTERCSIAEKIELVRSILDKCKFDVKCETGVTALNQYHQEVNKAKSNEDQTYFLEIPAKDRYSHPADAFGELAKVYRYGMINGQALGYTGANPEWLAGSREGIEDLLSVG